MQPTVSTWNVGACFACTKCLLRSTWRRCPRCQGDTVDLRVTSLETSWSAWRGFAEGWSLASWRAPRALNVLSRVAAAFTFFCCLGPVIGPWLDKGAAPSGVELLLSVVLGAVVAWPLWQFFRLYLLFIAHVLRGLAWITSFASEISPVGTLKFSVIARLCRGLSRPLLPQLEVFGGSSLEGAPVRGVLSAPVVVNFVRDGWGFMARFDAHVASKLALTRDDGAVEVVELTHGGVQVPPTVGTRSDGSTLPAWLDAPKRPGVRFMREVPAGTRVTVTRGREGLDDARVHVVFG